MSIAENRAEIKSIDKRLDLLVFAGLADAAVVATSVEAAICNNPELSVCLLGISLLGGTAAVTDHLLLNRKRKGLVKAIEADFDRLLREKFRLVDGQLVISK